MNTPKLTIQTAVPFPSTSDSSITYNNHQRALLLGQGLTNGMIHQLELASADTLLHVWILDNSASTNQTDCHRYIIGTTSSHELRPVKCTRWEDIMDTALYHAQMATWIHAPTVFRLLNPCPDIVSEFTITSQPYSSDESAQYQLQRFQQWLKSVQPTGRTPLTHHMYEIQQLIRSMKQSLRSKGQHIVLIMATDGIPTDEKGICNDEQCDLFRKSLKALENLPIQVIFRLNTKDSSIRKFYADIKYDVRFRMCVIHSFFSEAQSIRPVNDWFTYSLSIHRMREIGAVSSYLDLVSERRLSLFEMRDYCIFLFGYDAMTGVVDPTSGWARFLKTTKRLLKVEQEQWDPCSSKLQPMLNAKRLAEAYGPSSRCNIL